MILKEMFARDIGREISGVIKVGEVDDVDKVYQELEEYVVTREISQHLDKFYNNYGKGIDGKTDKIGVWISGFFGSGKSHFLKILSHVLDNDRIKDKQAVEFFADKITDPLLYGEMQRVAKVNTETILFNIDAENPINNKSKDDAILRIFIKVFNRHRGLCVEIPGVAYMEEQLIKDGVYEAFKAEFLVERGKEWLSRRNAFFLDKDYVARTLAKVLQISLESATEYVSKGVNEYQVDIKQFAQEVKRYIDSKGGKFHLIFLVDEIGQYIGDNTNLMLDLQTVSEELGTHCKGQAWIMVTSQESIDSIIKVKGDDFSKIQGRFDTRLSLSSISVDEVIKKRILEKEENAVCLLKSLYREKSATLKNLINFDNARKDLLSYRDEKEFVEVYPFIPYQFKVLQSVFEQVRKHGNSGKNLSEGERSMLSAFKESVFKYRHDKEGRLIPFHAFYDTIKEFLNPVIHRVIERATENPELKDNPINMEVLKVLFMVKYLSNEIPANLENIATLMLSNMDEDKLELKEQIKITLRKLQSQTLIQKNGDLYIFLTDDEQDVNREIKDVKIDGDVLKKELANYIFQDIYDEPRFKYSKYYSFPFNKKMDEKDYGNQTSSITLNILTALSDQYHKSDEALILQSNSQMTIRLGGSDGYVEELTEALKIEAYRDKKNLKALPENIQAIITTKQGEARIRKGRAKEILAEALMQASFFVDGDKVDTKGSSAKDKITSGFTLLVNSVFKKLSYIKINLTSEMEILTLLKNNVDEILLDATMAYNNELAETEIFDFISMQEDKHEQIRMKALTMRFKGAPYGWNEIDIAGVVAKLLKDQKIKIRLHGEFIEIEQVSKVVDAITKSTEVDKTIINKKVKVDEKLLRDVRNISKDVFGSISLPADEDGLAKELRAKIGEKRTETNQYLDKKYQGKKYPGKSLFEKGQEIFTGIIEHKDNLSFFTAFREQEEGMLNWVDDIAYPMAFFASQTEIFDKGLVVVKKCSDNKEYLEADITENVTKLTAILNNPIPYKEIKNIMDIVGKIERAFAELIAAKRVVVKGKIQSDFDYSCLKAAQYGVSQATKDGVQVFYQDKLAELETYTDMYRLDAALAQSNSKKEVFEGQIDKEIAAYQKQQAEAAKRNAEKTDPAPIPKPTPKTIEKVIITKLVTIKSLKTQEDIDVYIRELKSKLTSIIKEDKEIELE